MGVDRNSHVVHIFSIPKSSQLSSFKQPIGQHLMADAADQLLGRIFTVDMAGP